MVDAVPLPVGHGPLGEQRGPAPADVPEDGRRPHDVQVRVLLAGEGGRRQVLCRRAGPDGAGGLLAELGERAGDRRRQVARDGDPFDGPADLRAERADRLPVVRVQPRQLTEPVVDRRRLRHDPPEGARRHAKATRHPDALDPRQPAQVRALAANDRDPRLVNLLKIQHVLLGHCDTSGAAVLRRQQHPHVLPHFRRLWPRPTILPHDPGLAASPPVRYKLKVAGRVISLPLPVLRPAGVRGW